MTKSIKNQLILIGIVATTSSFAPVKQLINSSHPHKLGFIHDQNHATTRELSQKFSSLSATISEKTQSATDEHDLTKNASDIKKMLKEKKSLEKDIKKMLKEKKSLWKEIRQLYKKEPTPILEASQKNKEYIINQLNSSQLLEEIKQAEIAMVFCWTKNLEPIIAYIENISIQTSKSQNYINCTMRRYSSIKPSEIDPVVIEKLQAELKEYKDLEEDATKKKQIVESYDYNKPHNINQENKTI